MDERLAAGLTAELRAFVAAAGTRRALPVHCRVGVPGHEAVVIPDGRGWDAGLRADLVERAVDGLESTAGACAWVTRGGAPEPTDPDLAWWAAARAGFERHGLVLPAFAVLHRYGWVDLTSGTARTWSRVRRRSQDAREEP